MMALFFGKSSDALQSIIHAFISPPARILDTTYGEGKSWKGVQLSSLFGNFELVTMDKRRLDGVSIVANLGEPLPFEEKSFDCVYFDPPYFMEDMTESGSSGGFQREEVWWTRDEFYKVLSNLSIEIPRILKPNGIFIIKVMDFYWEDTYFPSAFELYRKFYSVLEPRATFITPIQRSWQAGTTLVRANFIYYLVMKQRRDI